MVRILPQATALISAQKLVYSANDQNLAPIQIKAGAIQAGFGGYVQRQSPPLMPEGSVEPETLLVSSGLQGGGSVSGYAPRTVAEWKDPQKTPTLLDSIQKPNQYPSVWVITGNNVTYPGLGTRGLYVVEDEKNGDQALYFKTPTRLIRVNPLVSGLSLLANTPALVFVDKKDGANTIGIPINFDRIAGSDPTYNISDGIVKTAQHSPMDMPPQGQGPKEVDFGASSPGTTVQTFLGTKGSNTTGSMASGANMLFASISIYNNYDGAVSGLIVDANHQDRVLLTDESVYLLGKKERAGAQVCAITRSDGMQGKKVTLLTLALDTNRVYRIKDAAKTFIPQNKNALLKDVADDIFTDPLFSSAGQFSCRGTKKYDYLLFTHEDADPTKRQLSVRRFSVN